VFRYDHHCRWINNCVGQLNHKPFLLAVLYFWMCSLLVLVYHIWRLASASPALVFNLVSLCTFGVAFFLVVLHFFSLTYMAALQTYLLLRGMTQVEWQCCGGRAWLCHFDRGVRRNIEAVFGPDMRSWWLPIPYNAQRDLVLLHFTPSIPAPPIEGPSDHNVDEEQSLLEQQAEPGPLSIQSGTLWCVLSVLGAHPVDPGILRPARPSTPSAWLPHTVKFEGSAFDWVPENESGAEV
jgi:hypothetical protein